MEVIEGVEVIDGGDAGCEVIDGGDRGCGGDRWR